MKTRVAAICAVLCSLSGVSHAIDAEDTRMLAQPAISASHIAFIYDADLWVAGRDGSGARRLTTAPGVESRPAFSPDGKLIAFSGHYDGNVDVYVMPVAGGPPDRLTWHPGADIVRGFTPDGRVLFQSQRSVFTRRHFHLYTVATQGGPAERLPIPTGTKASVSPDGKRIAYTPLGERFGQWKNYRGGTVSRIWLMDLDDYEVQEVPQPEGRCNDTDPMWIGDKVYFSSDRDGEFNIHSFDPSGGGVERLTNHTGFPVLQASAGADSIVYEQAGRLHVLDPNAKQTALLRVGVGADLRESRPRYATGAVWIRGASLSPGAERVALGYRGEIVTLPAEKGDARNLTASTGAHDRSPAWSPDGQQIAYFSDAGGEYALYIAAQDGSGEAQRIDLNGAGYYEDPSWSPDGKHIAFRDNALSISIVAIASGEITKVAEEPVYTPIVTTTTAWSPDSQWLAYTIAPEGLTQTVFLYSIESGESYAVTDGLGEMSEPVFDKDGKYLYMLGSTDAGPVKDWFAQSSADMTMTHTVYAAVLDADAPPPLPPETDEVPQNDEEAGDDEEGEEKQEDTPPIKVDREGLSERIVALPVNGSLRNLEVGGAGEIYYLESSGAGLAAFFGPATLKRFTLEKREAETLGEEIEAFSVSRDGKKLLTVTGGGEQWAINDAGELEAGKGALPIDRISVRVDPRAEWKQIFREAWRINRDYFYATNFHGVDWDAMGTKYAAFLEHAATRSDLERIIVWMSSELSVGHSYSGSGETIQDPAEVPVGLLGADLEIADGRYRFKKVFGGLNWNPDLTTPLRTAGVNVKDGEYLLAIQGRDLTADENLYLRFEHSVGRQIELTIGPRPDDKGSRQVQVVPITSERALRHRDWLEGNLRRVDAATDGRVAYVYVPNTADVGHTYFKRYFYPQSHKQAIIVDERFNGGGLVADYYIDILRRPYIAHWAMRYGDDLVTPRGAVFGPKVMIIDETAGSGGDLLPWMFRKFELGPLVGKRTWGGLVGILGFPVLMDGGRVTAPNLAIWTEDGWIVENQGVPPDHDVEQWPVEVNAGRDPQLEKAIEIVLDALEKDPPAAPKRPPFPVRNPPPKS